MRHIEHRHPYHEYGKISVYESGDDIPKRPVSKVHTLEGTRYWELLDTLGKATYDKESADGKIQKEWVIKYVPADLLDTDDYYVFHIYDWLTFSAWNTKTTLKEWNVSGEAETRKIAEEMTTLLKQLILIHDL